MCPFTHPRTAMSTRCRPNPALTIAADRPGTRPGGARGPPHAHPAARLAAKRPGSPGSPTPVPHSGQGGARSPPSAPLPPRRRIEGGGTGKLGNGTFLERRLELGLFGLAGCWVPGFSSLGGISAARGPAVLVGGWLGDSRAERGSALRILISAR